MRSLPINSLRSRLTLLVIVSIFGSVSIVTASSVWREFQQYNDGRTSELEASANLFAAVMSESVAAYDRDTAYQGLQTILDFPMIEYARIDDASGALFLEAHKDSTAAGGLSERLNAMTSSVSVVVTHDNRAVGRLIIRGSSQSLIERIFTLIWDAVLAGVLAGGIGVLIALQMQRSVTRPLQNLSRVMTLVRKTGDFSRRASSEGESDGEAGELVATFNEMLNQIQERDAKLVAHQKNLKKIVRERTRQFEDAKEVAEAASLAKTEFLATMSHEIRTPMNGMLVMAELLSNTQLAPRQKRYADVIVKSGQSLLAIINDILDFSKAEADKLELETIAVSPVEVINDVVGLFWEKAASKGIDLTAYASPATPELVEGDPIRISQVLSNLVNNALKFTQQGSVVVAVNSVRKAGGEPMLEFSVTDTGVGIAKEKQKTIFGAFSQADQSTTRKYGGTGLGLAICSKIVAAMGGAISVNSVEGRGARFAFQIPAVQIAPPRAAPHARRDTRAIIAIDGGATPKTLSRYLHEAGISAQIISENSAVAGHLSYTDIIFASPDFLDTLHKSIDGAPDDWLPARICVSELGDAAPDRLLESGVAEDLLIKPISRSDMMDQIERILKGRMRGKDAVRHAAASQSALLPSFLGRRVLAADDSAVNREVVSATLVRLDAEPTVAADGKAAVEAVTSEEFDLVLMDCSMPGMDGFEATRAIRQWEADNDKPRTPIIALTAHVAETDENWRAAGMDAYVTKPFTIKTLAAVIAEFLPDEQCSEPDDRSAAALSMDEPTNAPGYGPEEFPLESDAPVFDEAVLRELREINADLVTRSLTLFETHSKEAILRLVEAIAASKTENIDDLAEIASAAHALKSMSVNVGATPLGHACADIESAAVDAKSGGGAAFAPLLARLKDAFAAAHNALPEVKARFATDCAA